MERREELKKYKEILKKTNSLCESVFALNRNKPDLDANKDVVLEQIECDIETLNTKVRGLLGS